MEFRVATSKDAESVQRIARASWHQAYDHIIGDDAVDAILEIWYDQDALTESIGRDEGSMFLAVDDSDVVGFAQGGPSEDDSADATVGRIYVLPEYWGKGVGTKLLNRLFDSFRAAGHESVWLGVMAGNVVGRSFYDKHGFEVHEERTVELAEQEIDHVILVRNL